MDLTKEEILKEQYFSDQEIENKSGIFKAMDKYAEQEAKAYANWLSNQIIAGRTMTKLWNDYRKQVS
jgi:hypothetical protein